MTTQVHTDDIDPGSDGFWKTVAGVLTRDTTDLATQAELDAAVAGLQPLDSDLTAIAALSTTSYGRALLALADAAAGRTALGLGTAATHATGDYDAAGAAAAAQAASQPLDSDLTAIAALTTTSYGRAFLALADAAAAKTALALVKADVGLGSVDNTADSAKSVASAAVLTTARNIDGVSFNGSANITTLAEATHAATSKATPVDADELPLVDTAASNVLKKLTWGNLKATLKAYFDTLYQAIGNPPGYEIKYAQITSSVNVTSTTEATGTTIISPGAVTFDGNPVLVHFSAVISLPTATNANNAVIVSLFESSTQITRLAKVFLADLLTGQACIVSVSGFFRFTPTAGSHTYTVTAFANNTTGTPYVGAGAGGAAGDPPAFIRFTKV